MPSATSAGIMRVLNAVSGGKRPSPDPALKVVPEIARCARIWRRMLRSSISAISGWWNPKLIRSSRRLPRVVVIDCPER
jgi:hypothetical protein